MSTNTSKYNYDTHEHDDNNNNGHKASSVSVHTLHQHKTSLWNSGSDCVCGCIPVNFNASLCDILLQLQSYRVAVLFWIHHSFHLASYI